MRVAIYGSCITRDAVDLWPADWELVHYASRHPLGSLLAPSRATEEDALAAPAGWRRLQHLNDIDSTALPKMMDSVPELIIWDLVNERHGVHVRPDGGRALGEGIKFTAHAYKAMWLEGLAAFDTMRGEVPVILNAIDWDLSDPRSHTFAAWQNWAVQRAASMGIPAVRTQGTRHDPAHKWGHGPFHLRQQDYSRSVDALTRKVRAL